jgi:hypothetical protein
VPKENCTRLCGNMNIPFPFGIEEGCFANDNLQLKCTSNGTILDQGYAQYHVTNLSLDDGLLTVTNMLNDTSSNNMERVVITHYEGHQDRFDAEVVDNNFDFSREDIIIKWVAANLSCQEARLNNATYACISDNSFCENVTRGKARDGYRCKCSDGFQGNPYLQNNCTGYISLLNVFSLSSLFLSNTNLSIYATTHAQILRDISITSLRYKIWTYS